MPRNPGSADNRRQRSIKCSEWYWGHFWVLLSEFRYMLDWTHRPIGRRALGGRMMIKVVPESQFPMLRSALKSTRLNWYAIDRNGNTARATDQIIDAAIDEEELWGTLPTHVFVLGEPQDVTYEEIISGRIERPAFRMYEDGDRMFVHNFNEIPLDGVKMEDVDWRSPRNEFAAPRDWGILLRRFWGVLTR